MIRMGLRDDLNAQIIDEASEWFVEFTTEEPGPRTRRAFARWLRKSPEHARAYLEMFPLWEDVAQVDPGRTWSAAELIALSRAESNNVVALESGRIQPPPRPLPTVANRVALAASVLVACVTLGSLGWYFLAYRGTYATDVGEQRVVVLTDRSRIELNARSRVRVRFTEAERDVELLEGQALFHVEKDAARPFVVRGGRARVRAVGTQFDVHLKRSGTTVTVLEGRVAVSLEPGDSRSPEHAATHSPSSVAGTFVSSGEQVTASQDGVSRSKQPNVPAATAWRQRRLIFSATPLPEVAEEFNRYNERQLVVRDPRLNPFLVNGSFSTTDPASLIRFLRAQPDLVVNENDQEIRVTPK